MLGKEAPAKTKTVTVDGRNYRIPVDENGNVPESALISRFATVEEGDRDGRKRSTAKDLNKTASETLKLGLNIKPEEIARWWAHPNELDIIGIDDERSKVFGTEGATRKSSLEYQRMIGIIGTPKERALIRKTLDENFTADELKKIADGGLTIKFVDKNSNELEDSAVGTCRPLNRVILIRRGATPGTIVHETTHMLRFSDKSRTGIYTTSKVMEITSKKNDRYVRIVEEAGTEAETVARLSPYKINGARISYYGRISNGPINARKKIDEDRKLLTGSDEPDGKGLKGKKAVRVVEKNFTKTNISNLEHRGKPAKDYKKY